MEHIRRTCMEIPAPRSSQTLLRQVVLHPPCHPLRFLAWQTGIITFFQFTSHGYHKNKIRNLYMVLRGKYKCARKSLLSFAFKFHLGTYSIRIKFQFATALISHLPLQKPNHLDLGYRLNCAPHPHSHVEAPSVTVFEDRVFKEAINVKRDQKSGVLT